MAFEHNLNFVFNRDKDRANLILNSHGPEPVPQELEEGWLLRQSLHYIFL